MAVREIKTTIALDGEQEFKRAIEGANREMRVMDSELKAVTAAYRANGDSAEYFAAKQRNLKSQISQQENIVKSLEEAVEDAAKAYGEGSKEVDGYTIKLNNARTRLANLEKQLSDTDREVEELGRDSIKAGRQIEQGIGDGAREAEQDVKSLAEAMKDDLASIRTNTAFTAMGNLWNVASGAFSAATSFVDGTKELSRELSFLKQAAEERGMSLDYVKDQISEVGSVTGDTSSSVAGLRNLLTMDISETDLTRTVDLLMGSLIKFDDMDFSGLSSGLQETIATGEAAGQYAELLERLGVDVEEFNKAMEKSPTLAGDLDIALSYLAENGMQEAYEKWQKTNDEIRRQNYITTQLEIEMADFGKKLSSYIVTPTQELLLHAFRYVNDTIETAETEGLEAAGQKVLDDLSAGAPVVAGIVRDSFNDMLQTADMITPALAEKALGLTGMDVEPGVVQDAWARTKGMFGAIVDPTGLLRGTASMLLNGSEEAGKKDADAYFNGFERELKSNAENAKPVTFTGPDGKVIDLDPIGVAKDVNELLKELGVELEDSEDDLEASGEEAGNAMTSGFEAAFAALDRKAYAAGAGMAKSYASGLNAQVGLIGAAANKMSEAAAAAIAAAKAGAQRSVVLELDGRKVAEGIIPYSNQLLATEGNEIGGYRLR